MRTNPFRNGFNNFSHQIHQMASNSMRRRKSRCFGLGAFALSLGFGLGLNMMSMTLAQAQTTQFDCNFISKATQLVLDSVVNISVETETSKLFQKNTLISSGSGFFVEVLVLNFTLSQGTFWPMLTSSLIRWNQVEFQHHGWGEINYQQIS